MASVASREVLPYTIHFYCTYCDMTLAFIPNVSCLNKEGLSLVFVQFGPNAKIVGSRFRAELMVPVKFSKLQLEILTNIAM